MGFCGWVCMCTFISVCLSVSLSLCLSLCLSVSLSGWLAGWLCESEECVRRSLVLHSSSAPHLSMFHSSLSCFCTPFSFLCCGLAGANVALGTCGIGSVCVFMCVCERVCMYIYIYMCVCVLPLSCARAATCGPTTCPFSSLRFFSALLWFCDGAFHQTLWTRIILYTALPSLWVCVCLSTRMSGMGAYRIVSCAPFW